MEMMCFQFQWFQLKKGTLQFFEKGFQFPENLFQSQSIENIWNFHWLSHKNMPISQTEGYFENPYVLSVGFKMKTLRKSVFKC